MHTSTPIAFCKIVSLITFGAGSLIGADIDRVLPLPQWNAAEASPTQNVGPPPAMIGTPLIPDVLLTAEDLQDVNPMLPTEPPSLAAAVQEEAKDFDLSLFLPDSLLGRTFHGSDQVRPTPPSELRALSEVFIQACRASPTDAYLIDPDTHVSETQREDLTRFLEFHNRDAKISAYVVVTDRDQVIPDGVDLSQIGSGILTTRDSCLVVYPLGEPWRARVFLSNTVHRKAGAEYLKTLIDECAADAKEVTDPLEQMHRFTIRLSIRLFWLEKLTHPENSALAVSATKTVTDEFNENRAAALTAAMVNETQVTRSWSANWRIAGAALLFVITFTTGLVTLLFWHRNRLRTHVWMLPEIETPTRLGGVFSGGGGASIRYR